MAVFGPELIHHVGQAPTGVMLSGAAIQGQLGAEPGVIQVRQLE
jgi:hypothetical protein